MHVFSAIFRRELRSYFSTPVGPVFIVVFLIAGGYIAFSPDFGNYYGARQASLRPLFEFIPYLYVFLVPAVGMRLWAEERRNGTAELLFTLPVRMWQAVVAKFMAAWSVIAISLALTGMLAAITAWLGDPDWGAMATGYLGALLLGGVYLAIACTCSAFSKNQVIAFILSVIACIAYLLLGYPPVMDMLGRFIGGFGLELLQAHSLQNRYDSMMRGVLELKDLAFYAAMISVWLIVCGVVLDRRKAR